MEGTDPRGRDKGSLVLTLELIDDYLQFMKARGCSKNTLLSYRRGLLDFYDWLPEGKLINDNTAWEYQITLVSRYKPRSVNMKMVSINGFFSYVRRRVQKSPSQPHLHAVLAPPCRSFSPTFTH